MGKVYFVDPVKTLAVLYSGESPLELDDELARTSSGVERNLEAAELSAMKTRSPTVVLEEDPQSNR